MTLGRGSHWEGPQLGSDRSGGGLFEDHLIDTINNAHGTVFVDDFIESRAATYWTTTLLAAAGTVTYGDSIVTLSHNVANQGPSIRLFGTTYLGNTYRGGPGSSCAVEATMIRTQPAGNSDFFFGLMSSVNAHPLDVAGVPTVATIDSGAGFRWVASATTVLTQWDAGVLRTLTNLPTDLPAQAQNVSNRYGVRIDTTPSSVDIVSWYINRRRVFSHRLPAAAPQFGTSMTPAFGLVCEAGAPTYIIDYCITGLGFRP